MQTAEQCASVPARLSTCSLQPHVPELACNRPDEGAVDKEVEVLERRFDIPEDEDVHHTDVRFFIFVMILMLLAVGILQVPSILEQGETYISLEQVGMIAAWTLSIGAYLGFIVQNVRVISADQSVNALRQMDESWIRNKSESLSSNLLDN